MAHVTVPTNGEAITYADGVLSVPNHPIVPFIEGDGIGVDVTAVMRTVVDAAVQKAYGDEKAIAWMEIFAGEKAVDVYGKSLPAETLDLLRQYVVSIKGPLSTPVGSGFRSLNVAIRQALDLYSCVRPVKYFNGIESAMKYPELIDMIIFRENTEGIYVGIEWEADTDEANQVVKFLKEDMHVTNLPKSNNIALGIKPVSRMGVKRLVRQALQHAVDYDRTSVTLVHKGNIMKFTEGAFRTWGYEVARDEFGATLIGKGPWCEFKNPKSGENIVVKDCIADNFLQQIILRPEEYDVIATLNLNGDYISDALAAQVGGIGIAPGGNIGDGVAVFEATHGTAPSYAGKDQVNPGSIILSAEMMLRHLNWHKAADCILQGMTKALEQREMTFDLACKRDEVNANKREVAARKNIAEEDRPLIDGATLLGTKAFGDAVIKYM